MEEYHGYHVVTAGRAGEHQEVAIYLFGPGLKKEAYRSAESKFRSDKKLNKNIALRCNILFSDADEERADFFFKELISRIEKTNSNKEEVNEF